MLVLLGGGVAFGAPLEVAVTGLLLIGVAHLVLEVRYVLGHYRSMLHGWLLLVANVALVGVVLGRLLLPGTGERTFEVLVVFGLLAAAAVVRLGTRPVALVMALAVLVVLATWTVGHAEGWFVAQAHLHNLVPAVFLWAWSAVALPAGRPRWIFRAIVVGFAVVVPLVLLSGALDGWLVDPGRGPLADLARKGGVLGGLVPAGSAPSLAPRLLALFAFAQVVHYGVWCWFFPRHGGPADAAWDVSPTGRWLRRPWVVAGLVVVGTAIVVVLAWTDYTRGRTFYGALGAYHAFLELPVLLALVLGLRLAAEPATGPADEPASGPGRGRSRRTRRSAPMAGTPSGSR
ncbi:MAG: hypothetical protein U0Q07_02195 [Acidimicrobiales bacterium]